MYPQYASTGEEKNFYYEFYDKKKFFIKIYLHGNKMRLSYENLTRYVQAVMRIFQPFLLFRTKCLLNLNPKLESKILDFDLFFIW